MNVVIKNQERFFFGVWICFGFVRLNSLMYNHLLVRDFFRYQNGFCEMSPCSVYERRTKKKEAWLVQHIYNWGEEIVRSHEQLVTGTELY